ncbi:MAG: ABC transporter permease [Ignavibacteriaceae bacterium]|nr:ABC transporter permease [Ignavibacteriaceae bacterium]
MKKIFAVARWEFLEKVKTKAFIISLIITPIIIISFSILPSLLFRQETPKVEVIGVVDTSGIYFEGLRNELNKYNLPDGRQNYVLINLTFNNKNFEELKATANKNIQLSLLEGCLILNSTDSDSVYAEYVTKSIGNFKNVGRFEEALRAIRLTKKLEEKGVDSQLIQYFQDKVIVEQMKVDESGNVSDIDFLTTFFVSIIFILLLMMMVVYSGQMLVRSMIEEKSSRLIEMLVSSTTPDELLTGKIIGLSLLGLTQIMIWVIIGISLIAGAVIPLTAFNNIFPMLLYFVLGFLFYASLFVGIGSTVNTEQEAQQITTYLSLILMLPVVIAMPAIQNPEFLATRIFSYIPLTTPTVMLLRLNIENVSVLEIILTLSILVLSILIVTRLSAKIFRIGILSYGNTPSLKEIIRWIKE